MSWKKEKRNRFIFFKSIGFNLAFSYSIVLFISVLLVSVYFYAKLSQNLHRETEVFLKGELDILSHFIADHTTDLDAIVNELNQRTVLTKAAYKMHYALYDREGRILAMSKDFPVDIFPLEKLSLNERYPNDTGEENVDFFIPTYLAGGARLIAKPIYENQKIVYFIQIGIDLGQIERALSNYRRNGLFVFPLVFVIAMAGGLILARRSLAPLAKITASAKDINVSNLDKRLHLRNTGDELDELAGAFNDVFARLQKSYQKIVQFTADASHELRLPITTIRGEAEVVLERERSIEEYKEVLASIIEEFERLSKMINSLLILSRADSGHERLEFQEIELGRLIKQVYEFFRVVAESKGIDLRIKGSAVCITGDKTNLERLFSNLIDNAIKYTLSGGQVEIKIESNASFAIVSIKDTGIGISQNELTKIFDRFYRVDKSRARVLGSIGLGLSICQSIVEIHHGEIKVESWVGSGSTFTVLLPREKSA